MNLNYWAHEAKNRNQTKHKTIKKNQWNQCNIIMSPLAHNCGLGFTCILWPIVAQEFNTPKADLFWSEVLPKHYTVSKN